MWKATPSFSSARKEYLVSWAGEAKASGNGASHILPLNCNHWLQKLACLMSARSVAPNIQGQMSSVGLIHGTDPTWGWSMGASQQVSQTLRTCIQLYDGKIHCTEPPYSGNGAPQRSRNLVVRQQQLTPLPLLHCQVSRSLQSPVGQMTQLHGLDLVHGLGIKPPCISPVDCQAWKDLWLFWSGVGVVSDIILLENFFFLGCFPVISAPDQNLNSRKSIKPAVLLRIEQYLQRLQNCQWKIRGGSASGSTLSCVTHFTF